jgi:23S rRNA (cytosine1962-C5)-methyltransferase
VRPAGQAEGAGFVAEPQAIINRHGADRLAAGHLWVYRGDVRRADAEPGDAVRLSDEAGRFLGRALFSDRSQIALRLIERGDVPIDRAFLLERIRRAAAFREEVVRGTEVFRLFYGESDGIPGVIVDRYGDYLVVQTLCQGAEKRKGQLIEILVELLRPRGIIERNDPKVRQLEGLAQVISVLYGEVPEKVIVAEGELRFAYDLFRGQKTGGFLDQRENRRAAAKYARGEALDCFTGTGGFALSMACGCASVEGIDMSRVALEAASLNRELNGITNVEFREANCFDALKQYHDAGRRFDFIVLDPPAFAKNRQNIPAARRGYKEINLRSLKLLRPGGYLITCSCSHHIPEYLFLEILAEAALDARREVIVVERRTQASDHPILLTVPETYYIKCLILKVFN